jgi:hypothetical protein
MLQLKMKQVEVRLDVRLRGHESQRAVSGLHWRRRAAWLYVTRADIHVTAGAG